MEYRTGLIVTALVSLLIGFIVSGIVMEIWYEEDKYINDKCIKYKDKVFCESSCIYIKDIKYCEENGDIND